MRTLIGHHLGLKGKGSIEKLLAEGDSRATELHDLVTSFLESKILNPSGMYRFFPAQAEGDDVIIYHPEDAKTEIETIPFSSSTRSAVFMFG